MQRNWYCYAKRINGNWFQCINANYLSCLVPIILFSLKLIIIIIITFLILIFLLLLPINCKKMIIINEITNSKGKGKMSASNCPVCKGAKVVRETKDYTVKVKPGMKDKQKIIFKGESD